jgi:regulatory protein
MSGAVAKAIELLSVREHFREELRVKLERRDFPQDEVEAALDRCEELGYLDDERAASRFVEISAVRKGWGPRRLEMELVRRGVERGLAARAARLDRETVAAALVSALRRVESRARAGWWRVSPKRARMVSSLVNRGFDAEDARQAVDRLAAERESFDHATDAEPRDPLELS